MKHSLILRNVNSLVSSAIIRFDGKYDKMVEFINTTSFTEKEKQLAIERLSKYKPVTESF